MNRKTQLTSSAFVLLAIMSRLVFADIVADTPKPNKAGPVEKGKGASWSVHSITNFVRQICPERKIYLGIEASPALLSIDGRSAPTNIEMFLKLCMATACTDKSNAFAARYIVEGVTNNMCTGVLVWGVTNYFRHYAMNYKAEEGETVWKLVSDACVDALRKIGTPDTVSQLIAAKRQMRDEFPRMRVAVSSSIDPDEYPKTAKQWLLHHPEEGVRFWMLQRWLHCTRPETPEVVEEAMRLPFGPSNCYWSSCKNDRNSLKSLREYIKGDRKTLGLWKKKYKRWVEDGKRMPLHYGCYNDEYWEAYKNRSEQDRIKRYGKMYKRTRQPEKAAEKEKSTE